MKKPEIEDIYPLSPMQRGMLFHALYEPGAGVYLQQVSCTLPAGLDVAAWQEAWNEVVKRHAALRTSLVWKRREQPLQVVLRRVELHWQELDWSRAAAAEQTLLEEAWRSADLQAGLPLERAPLMRFTLARLGGGGWRFLWSVHHLVVDGWSVALALGEAQETYAALRRGLLPPAAPAPSYGEYVHWLERLDPAAAEAFWRAELGGFAAPTPLGVERAAAGAAAAPGGAGWESAEAVLPAAASAALRELARGWRLTLSTVIQGAWAYLLGAYGGGDDVVFGLTVFGRPPELPDSDRIVGLFINTLPVRVRLRPAEPLRAWLEELQRRGARRGEFQHAPLSDLQGWSAVPRGRPLFESLLILDSAGKVVPGGGGEDGDLADLRIEGRSNYPLNLVLVPDVALVLRVLFDDRRLDAAAVRLLARHLCNLLDAMAAVPGRRVGELPLLDEAEVRQLLWAWNPAAAPYPRDKGLAELFAARVASAPEALAVDHGGECLSYAELDRRSNQLARRLRRLGAGVETMVAVCLERSAELVLAMLAVIKAGAAYVPLDPDHPAARLRFMLQDSGAAVLVSRRGLADGLAGGPARLLRLDADAAAIAAQPAAALPPRGGGEHLAYLIYTSGSTGKPKGVAVEQRAVSRLALGTDYVDLAPGDRIAQAANASFDAITFEVWGALLTGGAVIGVGREVVLAPAAFGAWLESSGIDVLFVTTALARQLARAAPASVHCLRLLLFGGERSDPRWVRKLLLSGRARRLLHVYGPTESTTFATCGEVAEIGAGDLAVPIGRAIAHTDVVVLDAWLRLVPVGVPGELHVGGDGLARAYWQRPELTASRFVPDPLADGRRRPAGRRLYRTGDLVRWLPGGSLEFLGRLDSQVKVRGFRVEPGEVEAALLDHPGVREAAVVVCEPEGGDRSLAAFWTAAQTGVDGRALARWLRGRLPEPMVPAAWHELAELPVTANGKVDRGRLAQIAAAGGAPPTGASAGARRGRAPWTPTQEILASIWSDLLRVGSVGVDDNFFDLGGHSLLATQVASRIALACGVEVPLATVFETPELGELASRIESLQAAAQGPPPPPILPVPRDRDLPLSHAQERMWLVEQMLAEGAAYNMPAALSLHGDLHVAALRFALGEVVRRHEVLRTTFVVRLGRPLQAIAPAAGWTLPVVALTGLPAAAGRKQARLLAIAAAGRRFDLERGPLLRVALLRLAADHHVLLLVMHHIVADGWSMDVLVAELTALYRAALAGRPAALPELPVQYADYAVWQREVLGEEVLSRQLQYWRERLAGAPATLDLPADRPRPALQSFRGGTIELELDAATGAGLRQLARRQGATLFMVLLAGLAALLRRLTGQQDVVLGTPIANRNRLATERLIGFFVNSLVLRLDVAGSASFGELVQQARRAALDAYAHQDLPFERLVEELRPERHLSRSPLFQVGMTLHPAPFADLALPGLQLAPFEFPLETVKFDLDVAFVETGEAGLHAGLGFARDLFDAATVRRLAEQVEVLLRGAAAEPAQPVSELPLLGPALRHQLTREWNDTAASAQDGDVIERWRVQAQRSPRSVALRCGDATLSYRELDVRARRLAWRLLAAGAGPGARVALCTGRSPELVVGIFGALMAGCAYVCLDAAYPPARLAFMLADAAVAAVVTAPCWAGQLPASGAVVMELEAAAGADGEEREPPPSGRPSDIAYLIYTSGTTGQPKAVMVPRGGLANTLAATQRLFHFAPGDQVAVLAPASFDAFALELLSPLLEGGTAVLVPRSPTIDVDRLVAGLGELTRIICVTALMRQIVDGARRSTAGAGGFPRMRTLGVGGDTVPAPLLADMREVFPGAEIWVLYGPTEAAILSSGHRVAKAPEPPRPLLGRPLDNVTLQLRDGAGQLVPPGVVGELWIGGAGISPGYWGQEALSAERFVTAPAPEAGTWFRSGDLARQLADGNLEFAGRSDEQVKVRGFRVELGEIESALAEHPGVRAAVVAVHPAPGGDRRLAAYVVPAARETPCSVAELRQWLRSRLPDHMVPAAFLLLDALPLTVHGKVDRRALPAPGAEWHDRAGGAAYEPPRTAAEKGLAMIWAEVLGVERVGLADHFFELGGHSLLATQVASRVRAELGTELPLLDVFQQPVLRDMAQAVERSRRAVMRAIQPAKRSGPLPLSFAQQRLWFLDRLAPNSPFYNIFSPLRLHGRIDLRALSAAFDEIVRRHESLRTCFPADGGQPRQQIAPAAALPLPLVDLSGLGSAAGALERLIELQKLLRFDLGRGPLLRALLVREGPEQHALLITVHHIVADGWSIEILFHELIVLYNDFCQGLPSTLPALPIQYADFALWQREWLRGDELARQLRYWQEQLADAPPLLELPFDRPVPLVEGFRGGLVPLRVPAALGQRLRQLARAGETTLPVLMLAAWKTLLHRYTGQDDVLVGTAVANRTRQEIEPLIGFFVNTLVLRSRFGGDPSFADLLQRLRETSTAAYGHQDLPFEMLVEELAVERSLSRNPVCQVMFGFHNFPLTAVEARGLRLSPFTLEQVETGTAKFDLTLFAWEHGAGVDGMVEYNGDLFDRATLVRVVSHFEELLRAIASAPGTRVSLLRMLAPGELAQLLREWNDTAASYPREVSLQQVFEAQAARDPEAVALVSAAGAVTYGELNARANRLAARLQALGAGVESRVGVCLERSVAAIVTVVAVIKAGAAYVPLDPQYPAVRRELMMQLAEVSALVTRRPLLGIWAGSSVPALCIDEMGEDGPAGENPASVAGPDNLAYVIFTSGSTGVPKATAVPHRGVLRLVLGAGYVRYGPEQVLLQLAPLAFDASTFEIWGALLHGGRLAILPPGTPTLDELAAAIERHGVSLLFLTSGLFRHFIEARIERLQGLEQLLSGGEAMPVAAAQRVLQALPGTRFANIYGPTENTVYTAWCPLSGPQDVGAAVAIGRPIDNTSLHLLDRRLEPVPIGIGGELYCGGDGVVRGYLGRPDLTAERFVPDPFGVGGRLYRTGDRARLLADGRVEFLGRIDQQIKIRGFRVELEEIELVLASHPAVRAAAVRAHEMGPGDRRLVGYVVAVPPAADPAGESMRPVAEQVASWARLFDQVYQREPAPAVPDFNIVGWESSYTGAPIPAEEMREWLDDTVERIIALGPRRVLEIGCGSGLLLLRIAPSCAAYVGTDISRQALDGLALEVAARGLSQVELLECAAADFSRIEPGSMDCVVLNSVVQYFPSVDYLADVLERAVAAVAPDGWVFIGDVRSLPLLQAFHASVTLFRAASEETLGELQERAAQAVEREPELAVHPAFFHALRRRLPQIGGVRVQPKRGKSHNELSKFRYQVLLRIGEPARQGPPAGWEDGAAFAGGAPALRRRLVEEQPAVLALANLRNSRVAADLAAARLLAGETAGFAAASGASSASETAAGLRQRLAVAAADCLDPEDVRTVAAGVGYAVALGCASDAEGGCFEAVLLRLPETHLAIAAAAANAALDPGTVLEAWTSEPAASRWPLDELANDPLRARRREELDTELRGYLEARLPAYMVPATLLQLESMPLTPSGKVDRKALPAPGTPRAGTRLVAAADAVERALVKIWERVLGVPVGVTDRFFDLGGHSLLAIRLMAEIRGRFGVEPPLTDLFLYPTVREFAVRLRHPARAGGGARVDLRPAGRLPPLFLVQPGRGDAFCYLDLAQALAGEHPVIGLQSPPPDSGTHRGRIEAMAAAQLGELRRCRPTGPYLLGGWSLGGVVAYEMACQLAREGDEVDLLALFDSSPGSAGDLRPPPDDALLLQLFGGVPLPALEGEGRGLDLDRQLQHLLAVPRLARLLPADTGAAELRPLFEEFRDNALGFWHYRATPYRGRVLLFRAARSLAPEPALGAADPRLGWDELCPSLELREVPGDHYSMLRSPQVEVLAGMLAVELAAVGAPAAAAVAAGGEGR